MKIYQKGGRKDHPKKVVNTPKVQENTTNQQEEVINKDGAVKEKQKKTKKEKVIQTKKYPFTKVKPLSFLHVLKIILGALIGGVIIAGVVYAVDITQVKCPRKEDFNYTNSGLNCLDLWQESFKTLSEENILANYSVVTDDSKSYLCEELIYANGDKSKERFIKDMVNSVVYSPVKTTSLNKYGNTYYDLKGNKDTTKSLVNGEKERIIFTCVDYDALQFDADRVKELMEKAKLTTSDVDYSNKLPDIFCDYVTSLEKLPTRNYLYTPNLIGSPETGFKVDPEEEIYLDNELFASEKFYDALDRFSVVAAGNDKDGNPLLGSDKEKWNPKLVMSKYWCGSYKLTHPEEGSSVVSAQLGDGSFENPAGLNTWVVTSQQKDGEWYPIRVRVIDYKVSQEALDLFQSKDIRNRGYDIKSNIQYMYMRVEVQNLSDTDLIVQDNIALCDDLANVSPRTGTMYGLDEEVTLKPNETGQIDCWGSSTELNKKYVIWGKDFQRHEDAVWLRYIMGNPADKTEAKGVFIPEENIDTENQ